MLLLSSSPSPSPLHMIASQFKWWQCIDITNSKEWWVHRLNWFVLCFKWNKQYVYFISSYELYSLFYRWFENVLSKNLCQMWYAPLHTAYKTICLIESNPIRTESIEKPRTLYKVNGSEQCGEAQSVVKCEKWNDWMAQKKSGDEKIDRICRTFNCTSGIEKIHMINRVYTNMIVYHQRYRTFSLFITE